MYDKELKEKKNDLITKAENLLKKAEMEKRELTEDEAAELAEIRDNVKRIKDTLEAKGFFDEEGMEEAPAEEAPADEKRAMETRAAEERKEFETYIRNTFNERANNLTPAANSGGVLIPTTIAKEIIAKVYDIAPILNRSQKMNVKGTLEIPYYDEDTTAITVAYADEFEDLASNVGKFTNITLTGYLAGALSLISRKLINNSDFDIVGYVVNKMAYDIARFIENELINGTEGKITGLSTVANVTTAASASEITADELIDLQDSIIDEFQPNAMWVMSRATRTALRKLKDEVGRYLLQDDITSPFGKTLLGKPVYVSDNMPEMASGNSVIYYGDFDGLTTKFNEEINIEVLRERFATQHAYGIVSWLEFDAKVSNQQKLAVLKMAGASV
jgi:HK97 family phage major capsid protein